MIKRFGFQRVVMTAIAGLAIGAMSLSAEERPDWRTSGMTMEVRAPRDTSRISADLSGTVVAVHGSGDRFVLRTSRGDIQVEAKGGVPVYFRGARYRVRDLERGDRVAVDLKSGRGRKLHARSVEVISSRSHFSRDYRDYRGDRYLTGRVISFDARRDILIVRTNQGRDVRVDGRRLDVRHGRSWPASIRVGDWVEVSGNWSRNGVFIAEELGRDRRDGYGRGYGR
ncbi:MAG TPA: DUF5666 domain-containing protein [Thermoanaerobaculia bacterium]|nr:DUF5666 domain-containing protein [Thermoanaerobaculia bacterium]